MTEPYTPVRLSPTLVREWIAGAQRGAILCYASGYTCSAAGDVTNETLREEAAKGFLHLKQKRRADGAGFHYLAERSSRHINSQSKRR